MIEVRELVAAAGRRGIDGAVDGHGTTSRVLVRIHGAVQGVGFRPFVYRLARALNLLGWVSNSSAGVTIEAEGAVEHLEAFLLRLEQDKPPRASIQSLESSWLDPVGFDDFQIRVSDGSGAKTALVLPDIATCDDCLREIRDPADRRYRYPFTNCTNCGPRYTIIERLPYDRPHTSMKMFAMCDRCRAEYDDPLNRRFHAQPNACPQCGPQLEWWDRNGQAGCTGDDALPAAAAALESGAIVAIKGLGGFHLMVGANNETGISRLRAAKDREEKPFALMYPSLEAVRAHCELSTLEERLLRSPEAPIVLLRRRRCFPLPLAAGVAPGNPYLGIMLPYTPLHHVLMEEIGFPVVATSGNLADEPICINEHEARKRLGRLVDYFLVHNRPILRHADDSVVRVVAGRELIMRRARGFAPLPVPLHPASSGSGQQKAPALLGVGAQLKNVVSLLVGSQVFVSQHIGDLETVEANGAFRHTISQLEGLYETAPAVIVRDPHPDYSSSRYAEGRGQRDGIPVVSIQHHYAHVRACMAENQIEPPVLGISWDGTGYGTDGTVWGGEFLRVPVDEGDGTGRGVEAIINPEAATNGFDRLAHLRTFMLPGGEAAVREPWRSAMGVLYELFGDEIFEREDLAPTRSLWPQEAHILQTMLSRRLNCPITSSAGRLFDAVASLTGLRQVSRYEGQAAMELEFSIDVLTAEDDCRYEFKLLQRSDDNCRIVDWGPMISAILQDVRDGVSAADISRRFHNTLVESMVQVAIVVGLERVVLTGGCFQNKQLTEGAVTRLRSAGFRPYWHQRISPNDGGIALGQVAAAAAIVRRDSNPKD